MKKITTLFAFLLLIGLGVNAQVDTFATIAAARVTQSDGAPQDSGHIVRVSGTVYGPNSNKYPSTGLTFWINDGTAGIKVYATHKYGYTVNDGDQVTIQGYLSSYHGSAEIDLADSAVLDTIINNGPGTPDTPVVINLSSLNANSYGQLIQINNVNMSGAFANTWKITPGKAYFTCKAPLVGGGSNVYIYIYEYTDTAMFKAAQPLGVYNVRGIGDYSLYNGNVEANIDPRNLSDFIPVGSNGVNDIAANLLSAIIYPNPASTQLSVTLFNDKAEPVTTRLFDVTGKEVMTETDQLVDGTNNLQFNTANLTNGMYILEVRTAEKYLNTKIVVAK